MAIISINSPVALFIYRRKESALEVCKAIKNAKPQKLYLIADGPRSGDEILECQYTREAVEKSIDWDCEIVKIYSDINLGCAKRIKSGLDLIFEREKKAIILEDDTLPNISFFKFCDYCLQKYEKNESVFHISGCNFFPNENADASSYSFTSIINIWGWATWARAWKQYDIEMTSWKSQDKKSFLKNWCTTKKQIKDMHAMFDLHCENKDPWTWDYQWVYACWSNNGLSVISTQNLVQNLGMGPDSTHTKFEAQQLPYPASIKELSFPLINKCRTRDLGFERNYYKYSSPSIMEKIKDFFKKLLRRTFLLVKY